MYLRNGKIIRRLWSTTSTITEKEQQGVSGFGSETGLGTENNRAKRGNNKMMFPNEEGQDE